MELNKISEKVIGSAIEAHKVLGPGLLESVYQKCLAYELRNSGMEVQQEVELPIVYKTMKVEKAFRVDMLIEDSVVLELKAVEQIMPIYKAQLLSYLRLSDLKLGLLINFNVPVLKQGIQRVVNNF